MLFVAVALLVLCHPERRTAALAQVEGAAELMGLGLQQVTLTGQRFTTDTDIYAALDLDWDPATLGAVEDEVDAIAPEQVERALRDELAPEATPADVDDATRALAAELAPRHAVPR